MMKVTVIFIFSVILVVNMLTVNCWSEENSKVRNLREEILIYNLVNGLYLDKNQLELLLGEAQEVADFRERLQSKLKEDLSREEALFSSLKKEVKKESPQISPDLAKEIHQIKLDKAKMYGKYKSFLERKVEKVKNILNENQLYILKNFKLCLIPPKGSPRIGQESSSTERGIKLLERIRNLPSEYYEFKKDQLLDKFMEKFILLHPRLDPQAVREKREEIEEVFDSARALNNVDFQLRKSELVEKINEVLSERSKKDPEHSINNKIIHYLLNPTIIPILEEKIDRTQ